jgi:hypothetical protein
MSANSYEKLLVNFTKSENTPDSIEELNNSLDHFYNKQMQYRDDRLTEIQNQITKMRMQKRAHASCQTTPELISSLLKEKELEKPADAEQPS